VHSVHAGAVHSSVGRAAVEFLRGEAAVQGDAKDAGACAADRPWGWALSLDLSDFGERVLLVDVYADLEG